MNPYEAQQIMSVMNNPEVMSKLRELDPDMYEKIMHMKRSAYLSPEQMAVGQEPLSDQAQAPPMEQGLSYGGTGPGSEAGANTGTESGGGFPWGLAMVAAMSGVSKALVANIASRRHPPAASVGGRSNIQTPSIFRGGGTSFRPGLSSYLR